MDVLNHITLAEPIWLWLGMAAAMLIPTFSRARALRRNHIWLRTGMRIVCVMGIALALATPTWTRNSQAVAVIALLDESDSVSDPAWSQATAWLAQVRDRAVLADGPQAFQILRFASTPTWGDTLPARRTKGQEGLTTNIASALGLALGQARPDRLTRVLLMTDGKETTGNATMVIPIYRARQIPVFVRPMQADDQNDVAIVRVTAPPVVHPKSGFAIDVEVAALHSGTVTVQVIQDGGPKHGGTTSEQSVVLSRKGDVSRGRISFPVRIETESASVFRFVSHAVLPDHHPDNDVATLVVKPQARPRVLVIAENQKAGAFEAALRAQDLDVQTVSVDRLPPVSDLEQLSLLVIADSAGTLPRGWQDGLSAGLQDGLGLIVAGGAGGLPVGPVADLLPVQPDPVTERREPSLALGLVIDRSGSMSGPKMDLTREAARATAEKLAPEDLITVVVFDSQPHTVVTLQPAANRQRILSDISQISASGGTNLGPALHDALEQLIPVSAPKKHLIVLSDGQSPAEGIAELVETAVAANITVSSVGVGDAADLALLQVIANRGGGRFYHARDPASIPRIFTRETNEMNLGPAADTRSLVRSARTSELFTAINFERAPALHGRTRVRARPRTELLLQTPDQAALLVRSHTGLGQVLFWASDLDGRWSSDFLQWTGYSKFWTQIVRSALRRGGGNRSAVDLRLQQGRLVASVPQRRSGNVDLFTFPKGTDRLVTWPAPTRTSPLRPRDEDVSEAHFAIPPGTVALAARVRFTDQTGGATDGEGFLSIPPAPEFSPGDDGSALLRTLANTTGGQVLADDGGPLFKAGAGTAPERYPLRTPILWVVLALFLAELGIWRARFRDPVDGRDLLTHQKTES